MYTFTRSRCIQRLPAGDESPQSSQGCLPWHFRANFFEPIRRKALADGGGGGGGGGGMTFNEKAKNIKHDLGEIGACNKFQWR